MPVVPCVGRRSATVPLVRMERSTLAPPVGGAMIPTGQRSCQAGLPCDVLGLVGAPVGGAWVAVVAAVVRDTMW